MCADPMIMQRMLGMLAQGQQGMSMGAEAIPLQPIPAAMARPAQQVPGMVPSTSGPAMEPDADD